MSDNLTDNIMVALFPKNVHPEHIATRSRPRAVVLLGTIKDSPHTVSIVDPADYGRTSSFVATVVNLESHVTCAATIRGSTPARAEHAATSMPLLDEERTQIFTYSRAVVPAFASGSVAEESYRIVHNRVLHPRTITWFPGHLDSQLDSPPNLNDTAHVKVRALTHRAEANASRGFLEPRLLEFPDILYTFYEATKHYYLHRRVYSPLRPRLTKQSTG
ncbi:hypothetical protein HPB48_009233 [Haemaphysalis longicornis]|uniref:Uncharacterized protein n=1 Tax=Haemaphysalis longicornis TaxID=44386 RepID=A0A9J6FXB0_HAELO|nr:hypothetical protein HPB48_009233 [Haemaphysalis longicornis]